MHTCTCHGGNTRKTACGQNGFSAAAITLNSAADGACPRWERSAAWNNSPAAVTGKNSRRTRRRYYGSFMYFAGRGEMIPNEDSYCELDPNKKGRLGHPGTPLPFQMVRPRTEAGRSHAKNLRRNHQGDGRQTAHPGTNGWSEGDRRRRLRHSRSWNHLYGGRPGRIPCSTSIARRGRRKTYSSPTVGRLFPTPTRNPTLSISGQRVAIVRLSGRRIEERKPLLT